MAVNAWLTPDESQLSESQAERTIRLPGSLWSYVTGALALLTEAENWEEFGDATPDDMAQFFADVLDEYAMSKPYIVGEIRAFANILAIPDGWLDMNGQTLAQADYPELTEVVPSAWKVGSDIIIPDMEDSFLAHIGDTATLGQFSGANTHTLTTAQLPAHTHGYDRHVNISGVQGGVTSLAQLGFTPTNSGSTGSGSAHNNMPRNLGIIYAIYTGA
jgi:microcystin-dependent protein